MKLKFLAATAAAVLSTISIAPSIYASSTEVVYTTMDVQSGSTWGLDRIDGTKDGNYTYLSSGAGTRIYIVDTGVDATHPEFSGRVIDGFDAFGENLDQTDCNGHGTHVAGVAAGINFGVAKAATIVPIRVMNCSGRGSTSTLAAGIDWIVANHPAGAPAIVNMSIGGSKDPLVNSAVSELVSAGMVVTAAAGNFNVDACEWSPASAEGVITVGSVGQDDVKSNFSNWGQCVDIFAPGSKINSANSLDHTTAKQRTGTSQASPFVAGVVATYFSSGLVTTAESAALKLYELSEPNSVINGNSLRNNIANVQKSYVASVPDAPATEVGLDVEPVEGPITVFQWGLGKTFGTLDWVPVEGASGYRIYKTSSIRPSWRLFRTTTSATQMTISDKVGSIALYRVVALVGSAEIEVGRVRYAPAK